MFFVIHRLCANKKKYFDSLCGKMTLNKKWIRNKFIEMSVERRKQHFHDGIHSFDVYKSFDRFIEGGNGGAKFGQKRDVGRNEG